jgi:sugar phosphate isomerase/epimerase
MENPQLDIRIGTMIGGHAGLGAYVRQILPYGFESFQVNFWQTIPDEVDLPRVADDVLGAIGEEDVTIGAIGIYGNPLETEETDLKTLQGWQRLIDSAHLFGTDVVTGFTGRLRGESIPDSMPRFEEVFSPLVERAAARNVRIAFENCDMGGTWESGDWNIAHSPVAWEMMFEAIPAKNVGLEWEPCHQMVKLIDPVPQLRKWVGKVFHLHGKDATVQWDVIREYGIHGPKRFAFHRTPGFGDSNWTDIISVLRQGGFKGAIDIEGWHDPVYRDALEMTGQVYGLNYLKDCRGGAYVPNPAV